MKFDFLLGLIGIYLLLFKFYFNYENFCYYISRTRIKKKKSETI